MGTDQRHITISLLSGQLDLLNIKRNNLARSLREIDETITSISRTLDYLESGLLPDAAADISDQYDYLEIEDEDILVSESEGQEFKPSDLKLTRFKPMKLSDAITEVLRSTDGLPTLDIDSITKEIYLIKSEGQEKACKASITAALHRMQKANIVTRIDAGIYSLNVDIKDNDEAHKANSG